MDSVLARFDIAMSSGSRGYISVILRLDIGLINDLVFKANQGDDQAYINEQRQPDYPPDRKKVGSFFLGLFIHGVIFVSINSLYGVDLTFKILALSLTNYGRRNLYYANCLMES